MREKIEALQLLPEADKRALCEWLSVSYGHAQHRMRELSVFSRDVPAIEAGDYRYGRFEDRDIYYAGYYPKTNLALFCDAERKPIFSGRFYLSAPVWFVKHIDACLYHLARLDLADAVPIAAPVVSMEKWFVTYGHFKDEAYSLGDFLYRHCDPATDMALLDYPVDDFLDTDKFRHNLNYRKIDRLIFGDRSINAYDYKYRPLKLKSLRLVENTFNTRTFHSFPVAIRDRIRAGVGQAGAAGPDRILLTRSASYRDIGNKQEVEAFCAEHGFAIVNPEQLSYEELVRLAQGASLVVMYWGSALTNMVYFSEGTRIVILQSESYSAEKLTLWDKVIANYRLDVVALPARENVIALDELAAAVR